MQIVTGPNSSGKSVYIKQVALICFLARVGSFVPAHSAMIGPIDMIFTRLSSFESTTANESSFLADLRQMENILRNATATSLVIIDEFGKGTDCNDGIALFAACVNNLLERAQNCPRTLLCTHYCDFDSGLIRPTSSLRLFQMSHLPEENSDISEVVFLFKLQEVSISETSFDSLGLYCARRAGLDSDILLRAKEVKHVLHAGQSVLPLRSCLPIVEVQKQILERVLSYEDAEEPMAVLESLLQLAGHHSSQ